MNEFTFSPYTPRLHMDTIEITSLPVAAVLAVYRLGP